MDTVISYLLVSTVYNWVGIHNPWHYTVLSFTKDEMQVRNRLYNSLLLAGCSWVS